MKATAKPALCSAALTSVKFVPVEPRSSARSLAGRLALLALTALGCDGLRSTGNPELPLWVNHPGGALSIAMRRTLTNPARVAQEPYERGKPAFDIQRRRVFVGSADHGLYAIDASDGDIVWRFETLGPVQSEPLYDATEDVVYFGSMDGSLYKVRARDGKLIYRFATNGEVARPPVLTDDKIFFTNANDMLVAADRKTGKLKFYQKRDSAGGIEVGGYAGVAVGHGLVFTAFSDGIVMAYSQDDGAERWPIVDLAAVARTGADVETLKYLDIDTTPVLANTRGGPVVIVASYEGGVFALDAESGRQVWRNDRTLGVTELVMYEQPKGYSKRLAAEVPARRILIASSGQTGLWGLDVETGEAMWRRRLPKGNVSAPAIVQGALLVAANRYGLFLFSPLDGGLIDAFVPGNEVSMTPAAHGAKAFFMTNGGEFVGLNVAPPL